MAYLGLGDLVSDISAAITQMENTNPAYNNPGALIAGPGQVGTASNGIAIFPDPATGQAALQRQVQLDIDKGWTLSQLINSWAPTGCGAMCAGNNPTAYTQFVAGQTGIDPNAVLSSLQAGEMSTGDGTVYTPDVSTVDLSSLGSIDFSSLTTWGLLAAGALLLYFLAKR